MSRKPHVVRTIFGKELRQTWRDRSVLILVFLVPLALAGITTLAFGPLVRNGGATLGVVDNDHGAASNVLVKDVLPKLTAATGSPLFTLKSYPTIAAARAATKSGAVAAAVVIPAGFSDRVARIEPSSLTLLTGKSEGIGAPVAEGVLQGFTAQVRTNQLSVRLATTGAGAVPRSQRIVTAATEQRSPVVIKDAFSGKGTVKAISFFAPSMVVLALFFCGQILARGLVGERRTRTLARIVLTGAPPWRILAAKYGMALATGFVSAAVVLGVFAAFGARFGDPWVVILLVFFTAIAMISAASLAVLLAKTEEQATTYGTVIAFVLAILGGNFVPLSQTHGLLAPLALITPNGWAVRGFADLSVVTGSPLHAVGWNLVALTVFAILAGVPALVLSRRVLRTASV